jgi:hypothetical protein
MTELYREVIEKSMRILSDKFQENVISIVEKTLFSKFIIFGIYLALLITLYFVVWLPSYYRVSNDFEESLNIVKMLPPDSIRDVEVIRK